MVSCMTFGVEVGEQKVVIRFVSVGLSESSMMRAETAMFSTIVYLSPMDSRGISRNKSQAENLSFVLQLEADDNLDVSTVRVWVQPIPHAIHVQYRMQIHRSPFTSVDYPQVRLSPIGATFCKVQTVCCCLLSSNW